ncbi:MAG: hypothetical protein IJU23_07100, partial [Proteobacteria bacterium]|nr:hypothetical protein [Pseudomonadota bacterium]
MEISLIRWGTSNADDVGSALYHKRESARIERAERAKSAGQSGVCAQRIAAQASRMERSDIGEYNRADKSVRLNNDYELYLQKSLLT